MLEEKKARVYDFIKGNIVNAVVVLVALIYIFYSMVIIKRTDLSVAECITRAGIGVFVGLLIKQGLSENGFSKGYNSQIWKNKLEDYSKACNMANPYIDLVDNFYEQERKETMEKYRRSNLTNYRMRYDWFFDEDGNYKNDNEYYKTLSKHQKRVLNNCIKVKIYTLNLFSEYGNEIEQATHKERNDKHQRAKMLGKNSFIQIGTAIIGAYFTAMWNNWDWGLFIMATIQVVMWVVCGVVEMYDNFNYVAIDKCNKLTRKMELIIKFTRGCEKGLYGNTRKQEQEI